MRFSLIVAIVGLLFQICLDLYIVGRLRRRFHHAVKYYAAGNALLFYVPLLVAIVLSKSGASLIVVSWFIFIFFLGFVIKLIFVVFDALGAIPLLFGRRRVKWLTWCGVSASAIVAMLMIWGATINRYRIIETHIAYVNPGLPEAFDGYRVVQISDLHVGMWGNDTTFLGRLVDRLNNLDADLILFTGDIVNSRSTELEPMVPVLTRLHAGDGVYAVLGNHDYGDYLRWPSEEAHLADRANLKRLYAFTPMRLLCNESIILRRGADSIALIGVENIGKPPFHTYGDLTISYPVLSDSVFKILMSHNPDHWINDIADNRQNNIALTLSGHTHAMQMQLGGISPGSLVYPTNWGLYRDSLGRALYVNRGVGTVGLPMRVGATPEITVIELKRK